MEQASLFVVCCLFRFCFHEYNFTAAAFYYGSAAYGFVSILLTFIAGVAGIKSGTTGDHGQAKLMFNCLVAIMIMTFLRVLVVVILGATLPEYVCNGGQQVPGYNINQSCNQIIWTVVAIMTGITCCSFWIYCGPCLYVAKKQVTLSKSQTVRTRFVCARKLFCLFLLCFKKENCLNNAGYVCLKDCCESFIIEPCFFSLKIQTTRTLKLNSQKIKIKMQGLACNQ